MAPGSGDVDWEALRAAATSVSEQAYAPYSHLRVGAALLTADGDIVTGCNVENVSFGLTLCAECGAVSQLRAQGATTVVAVSCVSPDLGGVLPPCGRCRQVLAEHGGAAILVDTAEGPTTLGDLLPGAFGPDHLP